MTRTIRMVLATAALAAGIGTFGAVGANAAPTAAPAPASHGTAVTDGWGGCAPAPFGLWRSPRY